MKREYSLFVYATGIYLFYFDLCKLSATIRSIESTPNEASFSTELSSAPNASIAVPWSLTTLCPTSNSDILCTAWHTVAGISLGIYWILFPPVLLMASLRRDQPNAARSDVWTSQYSYLTLGIARDTREAARCRFLQFGRVLFAGTYIRTNTPNALRPTSFDVHVSWPSSYYSSICQQATFAVVARFGLGFWPKQFVTVLANFCLGMC